jgi:hypothetical protein
MTTSTLTTTTTTNHSRRMATHHLKSTRGSSSSPHSFGSVRHNRTTTIPTTPITWWWRRMIIITLLTTIIVTTCTHPYSCSSCCHALSMMANENHNQNRCVPNFDRTLKVTFVTGNVMKVKCSCAFPSVPLLSPIRWTLNIFGCMNLSTNI